MRSKESPNLYEILKSASAALDTPPEVAPRSTSAVAVEGAKPVLEASPSPKSEIESPPPRILVPNRFLSSPASAAAPGERVIRLTYNTVIFVGLVALGVVFLAYAVGLRVGRNRRAPELTGPAEREAPSPAPEVASNVLSKVWTLKLMEWEGGSSQARVAAEMNADRRIKSLAQAGLARAYWKKVVRNEKTYIVLFYGTYDDRRSEEARAEIARIQKTKFLGKDDYARCDFVESTP